MFGWLKILDFRQFFLNIIYCCLLGWWKGHIQWSIIKTNNSLFDFLFYAILKLLELVHDMWYQDWILQISLRVFLLEMVFEGHQRTSHFATFGNFQSLVALAFGLFEASSFGFLDALENLAFFFTCSFPCDFFFPVFVPVIVGAFKMLTEVTSILTGPNVILERTETLYWDAKFSTVWRNSSLLSKFKVEATKLSWISSALRHNASSQNTIMVTSNVTVTLESCKGCSCNFRNISFSSKLSMALPQIRKKKSWISLLFRESVSIRDAAITEAKSTSTTPSLTISEQFTLNRDNAPITPNSIEPEASTNGFSVGSRYGKEG